MSIWPTKYPPFLWGVATSSHQIEGQETNDWTLWEQSGHGREASGRALDHWNRWPSDFQLLGDLGVKSYRFSLEWSRIEPHPGQFDTEALSRYRSMVKTLRHMNIIPLVTLHHFTLPQWVAAQGGFRHPNAPDWFEHYVTRVMETLGDTVDFFVTINEPLVLVVMGYIMGIWPPGEHRLGPAFALMRQLAEIHKRAYSAIKSRQPDAWVGLAHHLIAFHPWTNQALDRATTKLLQYLMNDRFIRMVGDLQDFIGVNYYTRQYGHWRQGLHPIQSRQGMPLSDLGWEIYPHGLKEVLHTVQGYHKPIIVTENGIAATDDATRITFLHDHLKAIADLQEEGLDIRGYYHWSFIDNFEWAEGYSPRFGLVAIDYDSLSRSVLPSGRYYHHIIETNGQNFPINVPKAFE